MAIQSPHFLAHHRCRVTAMVTVSAIKYHTLIDRALDPFDDRCMNTRIRECYEAKAMLHMSLKTEKDALDGR